MSVYENTIKWLQKVAPDMKFADAHKIASDYQQNSIDHSQKNYVILLLMQMIGVDDNGYWPASFKQLAANNQEFAFAMKYAGLCHGGHSCGVPGYEISMKEYYQKFIRGNTTEEIDLKKRQEEYKLQLSNKQEV